MVAVEVQERVDGLHGHLLGAGRDLEDLVARLHRALFEDPVVEARTTVPGEQRRHARLVHAEADPVAGHPRLSDLEQRRTDPIPVADAHLVIAEALDREVLAELTEHEVVTPQLLAPMAIRAELVHVDGADLASVAGEIALPVAVEVQPSDAARPVDGLLPDAGVDGTPVPFDVTGHPDVDGHERRHAL